MTSDNAHQRDPQATGTTSDNAKPSPSAPIARDYRHLSDWTGRCETWAAEVGNDRARRTLALLAERGRGVLAVIDAEPGLHRYLEHLMYSRAVALLTEVIRQTHGLIRTVVRHETNGTEHPRQSTADLWAEIEALTGRADELGAAAVQHPPRLQLDTVAGSRAMSRRLVDAHRLDQAADTIDAAIAAAGRLPRPDPAVDALAALAAGLREQTTALRAAGEEDWWTGYFDRAHREAQAAWERERAESDRLCAEARQHASTPARS